MRKTKVPLSGFTSILYVFVSVIYLPIHIYMYIAYLFLSKALILLHLISAFLLPVVFQLILTIHLPNLKKKTYASSTRTSGNRYFYVIPPLNVPHAHITST